MSHVFYRSAEVALSSLRDSSGRFPAFSVRTSRRGWLPDSVVLSAPEARQLAFAILRATFYAQDGDL